MSHHLPAKHLQTSRLRVALRVLSKNWSFALMKPDFYIEGRTKINLASTVKPCLSQLAQMFEQYTYISHK